LKVTIELDGSGQFDPRLGVNIDKLPDDVLLEILGVCMDDGFDRRHQDIWLRLVHVCRRWRCLAFASPRHLDLRLFCTPRRLLNDLDIWPELPIVIRVYDRMSQQDMNNIIAVLKQPNRVCKISVEDISRSLLEKFAAINTPFPELRELKLASNDENLPVIPESFMGGSAPRLRGLRLWGLSFQSLPKLLSSTTDLVKLTLSRLSHSGYTSPEATVTCLSTLTKLESLSLRFGSPQSRANRESRQPPRTVLPALTSFWFVGDSGYFEDFMSRIDPPLLNRVSIEFLDHLAFDSDTPLLRPLISNSASLRAPHLADIGISNYDVGITLFHGKGMADHRAPRLHLSCRPFDWQIPSPAQFYNSCFPSFRTLERLCIYGIRHSNVGWNDNTDQWFEFFTTFPSVKDLELSANFSQLVAPALGGLTEEGATEVLPALQNILIEGLRSSESVQKSIGQFVSTRQRSGRPVIVHHRERGSWR
jgi:hypothetical protein